MKTLFLASVAALALCAGAAQAGPGINAAGARGTVQVVNHGPANTGLKTLYDQNSNTGSYGFFSQTLSSYPQYDEYIADEFTVPAGHTWKVKEVDTSGFYYKGAGPASSVNVLFWNSKSDLPNGAKAKVTCDNITPTNGLSTGSFQITLPNTCKVSLKGGASGKTYWVTVQANMKGENTSGYWAWLTLTTSNGPQAAVYDYGGGLNVNDTKCYSGFETLLDCYGSSYNDVAFALYGKDKG